jgi:hypothetical protein
MRILKEKFMFAVRALAAERYETAHRERLARQLWIENLLIAWDGKRHRTLSRFLKSRAGKVFRRRQEIAVQRAKEGLNGRT